MKDRIHLDRFDPIVHKRNINRPAGLRASSSLRWCQPFDPQTAQQRRALGMSGPEAL
jgi:hypothetical protein